jgi:hypothetical protein
MGHPGFGPQRGSQRLSSLSVASRPIPLRDETGGEYNAGQLRGGLRLRAVRALRIAGRRCGCAALRMTFFSCGGGLGSLCANVRLLR